MTLTAKSRTPPWSLDSGPLPRPGTTVWHSAPNFPPSHTRAPARSADTAFLQTFDADQDGTLDSEAARGGRASCMDIPLSGQSEDPAGLGWVGLDKKESNSAIHHDHDEKERATGNAFGSTSCVGGVGTLAASTEWFAGKEACNAHGITS